jgi:bifunctional enzyme Fae/Hps
MLLSKKKRYLHIALNSTLNEAYSIIQSLPANDRILIEAGTPLIKRYGTEAITTLRSWWSGKLWGTGIVPYVVADMKTMDRAETEVLIAKNAGASSVICLGQAPIETINSFVETCRANGVDSMIDMMNIEFPVKILRRLKKLPDVVLLHRGVDEELFNKSKPIPYIQINKVLSSYDCLIAIAGGDTIREVQRAVFNGAHIVVVWKEFYHQSGDTGNLAAEFLKEIK